MPYTLDHIVINIQDDEVMLDFYTQVLQLQPERIDAYRAGRAAFPSVRLNAHTIIDLFPKSLWQAQSQPDEGRENMNHFCIAMEKRAWSQLIERLRANGIEIETGPVSRWGALGQGISIYFRDPEGNLIEARHYPAAGK